MLNTHSMWAQDKMHNLNTNTHTSHSSKLMNFHEQLTQSYQGPDS